MASVPTRKKRIQEINMIKENIRKSLPVLTRAQIRRYRIPYHEALCMELEEEGFLKSVTFIRSIIEHQDKLRSGSGSESIIWSRPLLKDRKDMLNVLYNGVKTAEISFRSNRTDDECDSLLKIGVFFSEECEDWWWLADHLLMIAANCASSYEGDGGKRHAISQFIYGRFLLLQMKNAQKAREHLTLCRVVSIGHYWTANKVLQIPQGTIHKECCSLLYRTLLILARKMKEVDPVEATKICICAQKRATDAEDNSGIAECLMELGICESKMGDIKNAVSRFNKVLLMRTELNELVGICETYIKIAAAHSMLGNIAEANAHLNILLEYSKVNNLKYFYGQALRLLGESHLNHGHAHEATQYLTEALQVFHELDDYDNREQVKNLAAISTGQEFLEKYRNVVRSCKDICLDITKLINWKDSREMFWKIPDTAQPAVNLFEQDEKFTEQTETDTNDEGAPEPSEIESEKSAQLIMDTVESIETIYRRQSASELPEPAVTSEDNSEENDVEVIMNINENIELKSYM